MKNYITLIALLICLSAKGQTHIKCHYFYEPDGESGTFDGKPLLDKHNNVTLTFSYKKLKNVKVGDTVVITYYTIPKKWDLDTNAKDESCYKCNSPYYEEYKTIVIKKY